MPQRWARKVVEETRTQAPAHVKNGKSAFQTQVAFVLSTEAIAQAGDDGVGIVDRLGPDKARQERNAPSQSLLRFDLQRMVRGVGNVLPLNDGPKLREGAERLQVARAWRQVLTGLHMERRIERTEAPELRSFGAQVRYIE